MAAVLESLPVPCVSAHRASPSSLAASAVSVSDQKTADLLPKFTGLNIQTRAPRIMLASAKRGQRIACRSIVCETQETAIDVPAVTDATWQSLVLGADLHFVDSPHSFQQWWIRQTRNHASDRHRPHGTDLLPKGIIRETSNLEMRPLWGFPKKKGNAKASNNLLAIAVGIKQKENVNEIVEKFSSNNFTIMLFHYDGIVDEWNDLPWSERALHVSVANQTKWHPIREIRSQVDLKVRLSKATELVDRHLQNGLATKVEKSRKQIKERKNGAKKIRGSKTTKAGDAAKAGKKK